MADIGGLTKEETANLAAQLEQQVADTKDLVATSALSVKKAEAKAGVAERKAAAAESAAEKSADALATATRNQALALQAASADPNNQSLQDALTSANHDRQYAWATNDVDSKAAKSARASADAANAQVDSAKADYTRLTDKLSALTGDFTSTKAEVDKYGTTSEYPVQEPLDENTGISGMMNSVGDWFSDMKAKFTGEDDITPEQQDAIDSGSSDPDVLAEIHPPEPTVEQQIAIDMSSSDPDVVQEAIERQQKLKTDAAKQDKEPGSDGNQEDFTKTTNPLGTNSPQGDPTKGALDVPLGTGWEPTHYADDLINSQITGIKPKFLYKVKFVIGPKTGLKKDEIETLQKAQFLIKTIDKPTIQMEHQDVNYYNFRTKVLTKVVFNPLNMVFFDDASNFVTNFFARYLAYISPVFNRRASAELPERNGMNAKTSEASAMSRSDYSFLQQIVIQQIYGNGTASTIFTFVNPRIEQFDFDGLDHEDSSPNLVTCSFIYDYIVVETPSKGAIIYNAQELVGAKTDLFSGGAVASREGIKTASLASLMDTVNTANGGVAANKTKSGSVYDVLKGSQFDLKSISGISDVNIASTLGVEKIADGYLDNKLFNLTGKVSSRMKGMNPIASKILSPLANQSINAMSKPLRGLTSMFDNTVTGAVNGVGQAASNSVTTGINSVISGTAGGVNSAVKSIGTGLNGITQSVAGSFNSATSSINKSISSGIGSTMDSIKSTFSSTTDSINNAISKPAESVASSVDSATSTIVKDLESGVEYDTSYVEPVKPVEGVDDII